jgi:hypothetical protein
MNTATRALWLAFMTLFSLVLGAAAGLLQWAGGDSIPSSILTGGAAFGAILLLLIAVYHFATSGAKAP